MKNLLLLLLALFFVNYLCQAQNTQQDFFEGEVEFKIEVKALDGRISQSLLEKDVGTSMIGKVKRDKYLMYQNTKGEFGGTKMIFLLSEGVGFLEYEKSDTIYKFSIEENQDSLIDIIVDYENKKTVLEESCSSVNFKYVPKETYGMIEYVDAKYFFNENYKLDKDQYSNHKLNFWNKFVSASNGAISVRNEILTYPLFLTIYEAVKITKKDIPETEFELSKGKTILNKEY